MTSNYVNLDVLPKKMGIGFNDNSIVIDWISSIGNEVNFKYENIVGTMKILNYIKSNKQLEVEYNNNKYKIYTDSFRNCQLMNILKIRPLHYTYEIGQIVNVKSSKLKIVGHTRKSNNRKGYMCECVDCKSTFTREENQLKPDSSGCGYCTGRHTILGVNDMWTTDIDMAKMLLNSQDGYKYKSNSNKKLNWKCPDCGNILNKTPNSIYKTKRLACPECSRTKSYPNRFMYALLKQMNVNFKEEASFDWSKDGKSIRRYDFYLLDFNYIIEMHGKQHYSKDFVVPYQEIQAIDNFKREIALNNGISEYIEINCIKSELGWIKENILKSKLANILDFNEVDWEELDQKCQHSLMIETCKLWNMGVKDRNKLIEIVGVRSECIYLYLKKGSKLGICDYNKEESIKNGRILYKETMYQKYAKPIRCIENNFCFGTIGILEEKSFNCLNIMIGSHLIKKVLDGVKESAKGYSFEYITKQEFNNNKQLFPEKCFGEFFILD